MNENPIPIAQLCLKLSLSPTRYIKFLLQRGAVVNIGGPAEADTKGRGLSEIDKLLRAK